MSNRGSIILSAFFAAVLATPASAQSGQLSRVFAQHPHVRVNAGGQLFELTNPSTSDAGLVVPALDGPLAFDRIDLVEARQRAWRRGGKVGLLVGGAGSVALLAAWGTETGEHFAAGVAFGLLYTASQGLLGALIGSAFRVWRPVYVRPAEGMALAPFVDRGGAVGVGVRLPIGLPTR